MQETGKTIKKAAEDVKTSFDTSVSITKEALQNSAKEAEKKMQDAFNGLKKIFE